MFGLGTKELVILAVIFILLFGAKKIPELSKSLVDAIKHMRGAFKDIDEPAKVSDNDLAKKK
jgi:sec-independent protein translocase protein TatA